MSHRQQVIVINIHSLRTRNLQLHVLKASVRWICASYKNVITSQMNNNDLHLR